MKAFLKTIGDFFKNSDGTGSSRRVIGISLVVCGIVGIFLRLDTTACLGLVTGGVTLLGLTTIDGQSAQSSSPSINITSGGERNDGK